MRIKRKDANVVKLHENSQVKVKTAGATTVVQFCAGQNKKCPVQNLSKDIYMLKETGEIKEKMKTENRYQSPKSVRRSINRLMDLIRCNVTDVDKCKWVTLTYSDVMTDGKKAFLDAKLFLRKLKRRIKKNFGYITIAEPQGEKQRFIFLQFRWCRFLVREHREIQHFVHTLRDEQQRVRMVNRY